MFFFFRGSPSGTGVDWWVDFEIMEGTTSGRSCLVPGPVEKKKKVSVRRILCCSAMVLLEKKTLMMRFQI